MPTYLRNFYLTTLSEQKKEEKKEFDKKTKKNPQQSMGKFNASRFKS